MTYAIAKIGGKQLKLKEGDVITLEHQAKPHFEVVGYSDGKSFELGTPLLTDVTITAEVVEHTRAKKIRVARFKAKSRYKKLHGHRQPISVIKITKLAKGGVVDTPKKASLAPKRSTSKKKLQEK